MGLEAAVYIGDLVVANPDGADGKSQGDDHLRLLKTVLQNTFPGMIGRSWRHQTKSAGYTVVANDNMTVLNCTSVLTLDLTAAATLGNGHMFLAHANGGDVILDPAGAELINGAATRRITNGMIGVVLCNGSGFVCFDIPTVSAWSTGDVKTTYKTTADAGWVMMDEGTIGDASSGGTTRANADTEALFTLLWNNTANGQCPVSGGRGANAAADFAASKNIALPKVRGRALGGAGTGAGLTARVLAELAGAETHTLSQAETPVKNHAHLAGTLAADSNGNHQHTERGDVTDAGGGTTTMRLNNQSESIVDQISTANTTSVDGAHTHTVSGSTANAADATASAHNNVQPTSFMNLMVKL